MDDIVTRLREWSDMFQSGYAKNLTATAASEIERLRQLNIQLADAVYQWQQFMKEYWPSLMCPPGTSAMRNWQEYFDQRKQHVNNNNDTTGSIGL